MAKVGYIFIATNGEEYAEDKAWMQQYGCVQVIEELRAEPNLFGLCRVATEEDDSQYGIQSVPTLILFRRVEVLWRTSGVVKKSELLATIDPFLK